MKLTRARFNEILALAEIGSTAVRYNYGGYPGRRLPAGSTCPAVIGGYDMLARFMVAAGREAQYLDDNDLPGFDAFELADAVMTDNLGRGFAFHWPTLELTGE